ncbi:MAG: pyridoxal 5'-phosphate synthase glutaminase subunit PdxT [Caldisericales bacterium]|nr:pyridoxal 5'-phosphate synthase glutaminase subunit PdxT [bacterium]
MKIGIFALQGDVAEHIKAIEASGCTPVQVRNSQDLDNLSGLVLPGGESTTFWKLSNRIGLDKKIISLAKEGFPIFGTCAGLIMMSHDIEGYPNQPTWDIMDITVRRNAYGRQLESHVETIHAKDIGDVSVAFIRAPFITRVGEKVEVLSCDREGNIVFVRQGNFLGAAFHPEMTGDIKIHNFFCDIARRV